MRYVSYLLYVVLACFTAVVGCSSAPETPAPADPDPVYTRTIVHLNGDTSTDVQIVQVTASQQRADQAARNERLSRHAVGDIGTTQQAITKDGSCLDSSLFLYDDFYESGNELCLAGTGTAALSTWCDGTILCTPTCHCSATWDNAVRSIFAGQYAGVISKTNHDYCNSDSCQPGWTAYEYRNAYLCETLQGHYVNLGSSGCN